MSESYIDTVFELRGQVDAYLGIQSLPETAEYGTDLENAVKDYLDCRVLVSGTLETSQKTQKAKLLADSIELISGEGNTPD
jgi:hypothetical protein